MIKLFFLSAKQPLTKTIAKVGGKIVKSSYPNVANFTSEEVKIKSLREFHAALVQRALSDSKPCLIKGIISRDLNDESRKGATSTNTATSWLCLDLDDAPFSNADEFMNTIGLGDVSYIWQASSSYGLEKKKELSGHIFVTLNHPIAAPQLKAWLMGLNFSIPVLESSIRLTNSESWVSYPLDVTTCQNDKLLYVAEPIFKNMASPIPAKERIQYVARAKPEVDISRLEIPSMDKLKKQAMEKRNALRTAAGLPAMKGKTKQVGEYEVLSGVGEVSKYECYDCGDYYRYNLNGGDSQAYWHPKSDFTYLHSFKGEPSVLLKEILPARYAELTASTSAGLQTPSTNGDQVLAFREKRTAEYWKGLWNEEKHSLEIFKVNSETQLQHFLMGHGLNPLPYVPEWEMIFDPHAGYVIDEDNHIVNTFVPTPLMRVEGTTKGKFPIIQRLLDSAVGTGAIQEHFLNWLACIIQHRIKTQTAWILHGTEGTGKGALINYVMRPIMGEFVNQIKASSLMNNFNGWQERRLLVMIDEIEIDIFEKKSMEGDLRDYITEPWDKIHRKGVNEYAVPSFTNYIFGSNKPQPVRIPMGDRRFNVGQYQPVRFKTTRKEMEVDLKLELPAFANYLLTRKADIDKAGEIMQTEARAEIQKLGITSTDEVAQALNEGDLDILFNSMPDIDFLKQANLLKPEAEAYHHLMIMCLKDALDGTVTQLHRDQVQAIFQYACGIRADSPNKFTSFLRHRGVRVEHIWINNKTVRGVKVKWKEDQAKALKSHLPKEAKVRRVK